MKSLREALNEVRSLETHPLVKKARKAHKDGVWDGNVDKNGNPIVHINGRPHTVVVENLNQDLTLAYKNIERLARQESGQNKKDYLALAAALKKRDIEGAKKVMRGISTLEIQGDLLNVVVGYNALLKAMYPKAKQGDRVSKIVNEDLQEADMFKVAKEFENYARKHGGIDKKDFLRVAGFLRDIGKNSNVNKQDQLFIQMKYYIDKLDTDVRDGMITLFNKNGMVKNNRLTREGLNEMRHRFVFDKAVNLSKAEKIAQQLGMKTDSETGRDYYYLSVDDGGNSGNLLKFLKATDGLHEESIIEMKFNRDGRKIEITKSGPSTKPTFHLKVNGKDHGKFDQEKKAMQYLAKLKEEEDNLNEARIVISTLMYDAITKLGLAQLMKKHDAYVNKQQTDKEHTTLSSPSPMFGRDLSNLIKKNSDKLMKILPEETQVIGNEGLQEARIPQYKPTKFEGKEFDRKKELRALKAMHSAIVKIAKMQDDMQYTAETGGTPRIGNPHAIHQSLRSAEDAIFDYMGGIERGHYDGIIDMDRD